MLNGEAPNRGRVATFLALLAVVAAIVVLKHEAGGPAALPDPEPQMATLADVMATDARVDAVEVDIAASVGAILLLQQQVNTQAAELVTVRGQLSAALSELSAATKARAEPPARRGRRAVPDPPAASYLRLN